MTLWLCATCGLEHADRPQPPTVCAICNDERQYLPPGGQQWTTLEALQQDRTATITQLEPGLYGITIAPSVGIGHRPLLITSAAGNVLWDAPGFIDDRLVDQIKALGGVHAIASSHPHLTGVSVTISHQFGHVPIWYNAADAEWIRRPDDVIQLWSGTQELLPGITLVQCGGHFAGSAVLHWADSADGKGVLLTGDTIMVNPDRSTVSFLRSYPNRIPLSERSVRGIVNAVEPWPYDRIYSGFDPGQIAEDAANRVRYSAERHIGWINDDLRDPADAALETA